jgi:predicted nucleic acid-binding protein
MPWRPAREALTRFAAAGEALCISRQILREFLAVVTRPQAWAKAITSAEAANAPLSLAQEFDILEDGPPVWEHLVELCRSFAFSGRQVHDVVAIMLAHGERRLLTFNAADFARFAGIVDVSSLPES